VLLDLSNARNFPRYDLIPDQKDGGKPWPQGGLMGMALHPQLLGGKPYVYLAYLYHFAGAQSAGKGNKPNYGGYTFRTRLVRYEYDQASQKLTKPQILCDTIPGSNDHNGGRLVIAPVNGQSFLFYSVGDLGAGQFENAGQPNHAQAISSYEGKLLRFNLEPDADQRGADAWIPNDNPFNKPKQTAVWSYGHRNPQGLAYAEIGDAGRFYSSEHGPYSDDEINLIEAGKNYGHPLIIGAADGNYDGLAAAATEHANLPGIWHTTYPTIKSEKANATVLGPTTYRDPIKTLYPLSNQFLTSVLTRVREKAPQEPEWPSEAPSSLAVYTADAIPGWRNSLLMPTLKKGKLIRLQLNASGTGVTGDTLTYFKIPSRYRDIALSPDGTRIYLAVDSTAVTSGPSKEDPQQISYNGCIVEFTYLGSGDQADKPSGKQALPAQPIVPARRRTSKSSSQ
jgi:PQQ-dependent dehydrogenase (s-GDH family)